MKAENLSNLKVFFGGELKATGKGVVEGYLIRFGSSNDTDLENDYFTKSTDYGIEFSDSTPHKIGLYYNHGMDKVVRTKKIGYAEMKMDDMGIWLRGQLNMADEYSKMIYEMAKQGKIGLSSGAASHMVEREKMGKAYEIKRWALAEASLTPTPAESRNMVAAKRMKADVESLSVGDFVSWGTSASDAMGKVVMVKTDGEVQSSISDYVLTGTKEDPAYVIKLIQKDSEGNMVLTEQTVVHRADALSKISDPIKSWSEKGYMREEEDNISEMVEGLTNINASSMEIADSIFDGVREDILGDSLYCLFKKLKEGMLAVAESGTVEDANALLDKFHMMALSVFDKNAMPQEVMMMETEKSVEKPSSVKDVERILRDAGLSRSQSKHLANLVWVPQCDVEEIQEPEIKTIDISADLRKSLLEKAKVYSNI
jgi:HK97 family phage prohead protease